MIPGEQITVSSNTQMIGSSLDFNRVETSSNEAESIKKSVGNTDEDDEVSKVSLVEEVPESSVVNESAPADNYSYSIIVPDKDIHSDLGNSVENTDEEKAPPL